MTLILPGSPEYKKLLGQSVQKTTDEQHGVLYPYWRQAQVVATDPATKTCTIEVGGDTSVDIGGIKAAASYVPHVNDMVWLMQNGSSYFVVAGHVDTKLPACRLYVENEPVTTAGASSVAFDWNGGTAEIETFSGMSDIANDRIICPWPGIYLVGATIRHVGNDPNNNCKRMAFLSKNANTTAPIVWEETGEESPVWAETFSMSMLISLAYNDNLTLRIKSSSAGGTNVRWGDGVNGNGFGTRMWMVWCGNS